MVLDRHGVERLPGAHCYGFLSGNDTWEAMHDEEPATFYLTDFLARHFDALVIRGLGLDRHPDLCRSISGTTDASCISHRPTTTTSVRERARPPIGSASRTRRSAPATASSFPR